MRRELEQCKNCNNEFYRYISQKKQKFCSKKCRIEFKNKYSNSEISICNNCGKLFKYFHSHKRIHNCCSTECHKEYLYKMKIKKYITICDNCGIFYLRNNCANSNKFKNFCSSSCSNSFMKGKDNYSYKNGETIFTNGYKAIRISSYVYKYEHRIIMEKHIGRELSFNEDIHHIDGNKLNNDISNLLLLTKSEHAKLHAKLKKERLNDAQSNSISGLQRD